MPKLRKFRIVNFTYNGNRHIYDQLFDFNQGDHAMLLLANGGGKTVLTQMMMQPIIPNTDLKTRKFKDYFIRSEGPTYLMNEWHLDSQGGILLTGLMVEYSTHKVRGSNEDRENLKIHTFTLHAQHNDIYKIDSMPLMNRNARHQKVLRTYDEVLTDLRQLESRHKIHVHIFSWSDSREEKDKYRSKLAEYGIIQEEWKNNIVKINTEEAGLSSFFEDAKKTVTLVKRKILPTIEDKMREGSQTTNRLSELVKSHIQKLIKNDSIIQEEKIYRHFLQEAESYLGILNHYHNQDEALITSRTYMARLLVTLGKMGEDHQEVYNLSAKELAINSEREQQIHLEEATMAYYLSLDQKENIKQKVAMIQQKIEKTDIEIKETDYNVRRTKALKLEDERAEHQKQADIHRGKHESLQASKNAQENKYVKIVLGHVYKNAIDEMKLLAEQTKEGILQKEEQQKTWEENMEAAYNSRDEYLGKEQRALALCSHFDQEIAALNNLYSDCHIEKNPLFQDYDQRDFDRILKDVHQAQIQLVEEIEGYKLEEKKLREQLDASMQKVSTYEMNKRGWETELNAVTEKVQVYEQLENRLTQTCHRFFDRVDVWDKEQLEAQIHRLMEEKELESGRTLLNIAMKEQHVESLKQGHLQSLPVDMEKLMEKNRIDYQYGYNWLKTYEGSQIEKEKYLANLPLLPYALIMDEKNLESFRSIQHKYELNTVLPIVTWDQMTKALETDVYLHTVFNGQLLNQQFVSARIAEEETEVKRLQTEDEAIKKSRDQLVHLYQELEHFYLQHDAHTYEDLKGTVEALESKIKEATAIISEASTLKSEYIEGLTRVTEDISLKQKAREEHSHKVRAYESLEASFGSYSVQKTLAYEAHQNSDTQSENIKTCKVALKALKEQLDGMKLTLSNHINHHKDVEKKLLNLGILKDSEEIFIEALHRLDVKNPQASLHILEGKLRAFEQANGDIEQALSLMNIYLQNTAEKLEEIKKLSIDPQQLNIGIFSKASLDALEKTLLELENTYNALNQDLASEKTLLGVKDDEVKKKRDNLYKEYDLVEVIPREQIVERDFKRRYIENKKERERLASLQEEAKGIINLCISQSDSIKLTVISVLEVDEALIEAVAEQPVNPKEIKERVNRGVLEYQGCDKARNEAVDSIRTAYHELKNNYANKTDLFKNLFSQLFKENNLLDYRYCLRIFNQIKDAITRKLEKYETDMATMKQDESELMDFALRLVSDVYDELSDLDKHSRIEIHGKSEKMLMLTLPKKDTLDTARYKNHLHEVIRQGKKLLMENTSISQGQYDGYLSSNLDLIALFDQYVSIDSIKVRLMKIEQNKISPITWEEVNKTSGGEVFVSVFILFITLLSYMRGNTVSKRGQGKVLVMDNPFGPVSSEHLLDPLFEIANTFDTQLICFTHLEGSSIMKQFDLIYSLRIMKELGSNREYVNVELTKDKEQAIETLESGLFKITQGDQVSLL